MRVARQERLAAGGMAAGYCPGVGPRDGVVDRARELPEPGFAKSREEARPFGFRGRVAGEECPHHLDGEDAVGGQPWFR